MKKKLFALLVAVAATLTIGMTAMAAPEEPQYGEFQVGEFAILNTPEQLTADNFNVLVDVGDYEGAITKIEYNYPEIDNKWTVLCTAKRTDWFSMVAVNNDYIDTEANIIQYRVTVGSTINAKSVHTNMYTLNFADRSVVFHNLQAAYNFSQALGQYDNGNYFIELGEVDPTY